MSTRLIALNGGLDITVLDHSSMTMGRDSRCDARIYSARVSRFHCCVAQNDDGMHVSDLGSTNGTRINGQCVKSGRLLPGDELMIAHLRYRVEEDLPGLPRGDHDQSSAREPSGTSQFLTQNG